VRGLDICTAHRIVLSVTALQTGVTEVSVTVFTDQAMGTWY